MNRRLLGVCLALAAWSGTAGEDASAPVQPPPVKADFDPASAQEKDAKAKAREDAMLADISWDAVTHKFVEEKGALVLAGSAWVSGKGTKLEADNIVFFRATKEVYAEGNIRVRMGESEVSADSAYLDWTNDVGYMVGAVVRVSADPDAASSVMGKKAPKEQHEETREKLRQFDKTEGPSFLRARDPYGVYLTPSEDPQARTNLIFRAERLIKRGRTLYTAENAFVTSDDMAHPMYGVKAGEVDFYMKDVADPAKPGMTQLKPEKVVARRGRLYIMGMTLFPFPTVTYDLLKQNAYYQVNGGSSSRWGPFAMARFGYGLSGDNNRLFNPTHVYLDVDERMRRGAGLGGEVDWLTGYRPAEDDPGHKQFERGRGHMRVYAIDEFQTSREDDVLRARRNLERRIQPKIDGFPRRVFDANDLFIARRNLDNSGPPSFKLDEYRDEVRGMVDFAHHQPLKRLAGIDDVQLDLKYQRESDRDFMLEYFQENYLAQNQPEALASMRKAGDNYSMELLYRTNPQDFDGAPPRSPVNYGTFTGYEPALTYSLTPTPLCKGFYISGELQAARMKRYFEHEIYNQQDFETGRMYGVLDISRPFKAGPVNFVPHIGTQQQVYDNSRDGNTTSQGALTYGLDVTSRFYGTFADLENDALGLTGMRHILEPRLSYRAVGETRENAENIYDFDPIDDLTPVDRVTLALDQTFQTRRPARDGNGMRTVNFAGADLSIDYLPRQRDQERLLHGDKFDVLRADGYLRVIDVLKLDAGLGYSFESGEIETATYGFTIDPQSRWRLMFEERFDFKDAARRVVGSDQMHIKFEYQLSERWGLSVERIDQRRSALLDAKGRQVERVTLTRSYGALDASVTYSVDRGVNDHGIFGSVRPALVYRNLIVPAQDLLVSSSEVSGDAQEAPEERNFDPFQLLKRRKTKGGDAKVRGSSMPPPPIAPHEDDVPVPPPPAPDKRAGVFEDPNKIPARRALPAQTAKVDDDEWTSPSATPASTR